LRQGRRYRWRACSRVRERNNPPARRNHFRRPAQKSRNPGSLASLATRRGIGSRPGVQGEYFQWLRVQRSAAANCCGHHADAWDADDRFLCLYAAARTDVHGRCDAALRRVYPGRGSHHRLHEPAIRSTERRLQGRIPDAGACRSSDRGDLLFSGKAFKAAQPHAESEARLSSSSFSSATCRQLRSWLFT
jgi:hypothetical protein